MDAFDALIDKFEKIKTTHPNISKVWIEFLSIKKDNIQRIMNQGESTLLNCETTHDIPIVTMALLNKMAILGLTTNIT